ncbi:hypothetical protein Pcac1_g9399 [Phytophthora cactorum]|nr:hypothetical protein Pcac1_g9399 [Phytophthora cactorum]
MEDVRKMVKAYEARTECRRMPARELRSPLTSECDDVHHDVQVERGDHAAEQVHATVVYPVTSCSERRSAQGGSANTQFQRKLRTE